jgi:hypothetical protein
VLSLSGVALTNTILSSSLHHRAPLILSMERSSALIQITYARKIRFTRRSFVLEASTHLSVVNPTVRRGLMQLAVSEDSDDLTGLNPDQFVVIPIRRSEHPFHLIRIANAGQPQQIPFPAFSTTSRWIRPPLFYLGIGAVLGYSALVYFVIFRGLLSGYLQESVRLLADWTSFNPLEPVFLYYLDAFAVILSLLGALFLIYGLCRLCAEIVNEILGRILLPKQGTIHPKGEDKQVASDEDSPASSMTVEYARHSESSPGYVVPHPHYEPQVAPADTVTPTLSYIPENSNDSSLSSDPFNARRSDPMQL